MGKQDHRGVGSPYMFYFDADTFVPIVATTNVEMPSTDNLYEMFTSTDGTTVEMGGTTDNAGYRVSPSTDDIYNIKRMNIYIQDDGIFTAETYGSIAELSNGMQLLHKNSTDGIIKDYTPFPPTKHGHWGLYAGPDVVWSDFSASGDDMMIVRWTFRKGGSPIKVDGSLGEYLEFKVNDDLTNLISHLAMAQGSIRRATGIGD